MGHFSVETYAPPGSTLSGNQQANNIAAVGSLRGYRALRYGANAEFFITDQRGYQAASPTGDARVSAFRRPEFPFFLPGWVAEVLDGGRDFAGGNPPETIEAGGIEIANFRKGAAPATVLGAVQKRWLADRVSGSSAPWKFWASPISTIPGRFDLQNLPSDYPASWTAADDATIGDWALHELAELHRTIAARRVAGMVTLCGNQHCFGAGLSSSLAEREGLSPFGITLAGASISTAGFPEILDSILPPDHALRSVLLSHGTLGPPQYSLNVAALHGVRSALEWCRSDDIEKARTLSNPDLAPLLNFIDYDAQGFATVTVSKEAISSEFVRVPRPDKPITASEPDIVYRVRHRALLWEPGATPRLSTRVVEGDATTQIR